MKTLKAYTDVSAMANPGELNRRIFSSIAAYLADYQNTANTKANRLVALSNAITILDHITTHMNPAIAGDEGMLLHYGLTKILTKSKEASMMVNELYDFKNEIGFLKVLM